MQWTNLYDQTHQPTINDISKYVRSELWENLNSFLHNTYHIHPTLVYSRCSMKPGWNVKYKKCGKSLCTLYPMEGFFNVLVVIGSREIPEVELMLPSYSKYIQNMYKNTALYGGGRWLMIKVTESAILDDVIRLIQIKAKSLKGS